MEEKMKPAYRVAYAIIDDEGNWHTSKEGALLAYTNEVDAQNGLKFHGGQRFCAVGCCLMGQRKLGT